jgi:citrate/tricarballylate utilization protein
MTRRYLHHAVFYGFGLCFAATSMAAFYEHFLDLRAPYPLGSWPVVLGTLGGLGILGGAGGLLWLKVKMDPDPAAAESTTHDLVFLGTLFLVALSGLLLLLLRNTPLMGGLLLVHLGLVAGFFAVMPWGKFVHGIYRYAALLRNAFEASREA